MGQVVQVGEEPEYDKEKMTPEEILKRQYELLENWEKAKQLADESSEKEMDLRKQVVAWCGSPDLLKGTEYTPLQNGYKLKIVKGINYNVDQQIVKMLLDEIAAKGPEAQLIAHRLMKWKASLSLTEYDLLDSELKQIINRCITTSNASPAIEIVAPSTKGKARAAAGFTL